MDGFLSTHTLFCNHKGRRQNGPPLVPTNQQNHCLLRGHYFHWGKVAASASEITGTSSCWLSWEAEECFAKKEKKIETVYPNSEITTKAAAL